MFAQRNFMTYSFLFNSKMAFYISTLFSCQIISSLSQLINIKKELVFLIIIGGTRNDKERKKMMKIHDKCITNIQDSVKKEMNTSNHI